MPEIRAHPLSKVVETSCFVKISDPLDLLHGRLALVLFEGHESIISPSVDFCLIVALEGRPPVVYKIVQ